jgi:hypothetical protein
MENDENEDNVVFSIGMFNRPDLVLKSSLKAFKIIAIVLKDNIRKAKEKNLAEKIKDEITVIDDNICLDEKRTVPTVEELKNFLLAAKLSVTGIEIDGYRVNFNDYEFDAVHGRLAVYYDLIRI